MFTSVFSSHMILIAALTDLPLFSFIVGAAMIAYLLTGAAARIEFGEIKVKRGRDLKQDDAMEKRGMQGAKSLMEDE